MAAKKRWDWDGMKEGDSFNFNYNQQAHAFAVQARRKGFEASYTGMVTTIHKRPPEGPYIDPINMLLRRAW